MKKIVFLIHDLGAGGAEKVLVNLVNNLDPLEFDITVVALFGGGVNEQHLKPHVHYRTVWKKMIRGNSYWLKLLTPKMLHDICIKEKYDIEISYLEGMTTRAVSAAPSECKKVAWVHSIQNSRKCAACDFRSEKEADICFSNIDKHIFVSKTVEQDFNSLFPQPTKKCLVLYNTVESEKIRILSQLEPDLLDDGDSFRIVSAGTLKSVKGFERLLRITNRLVNSGYRIHLYLLGEGPLKRKFEKYIADYHLENNISLLGYQQNPYKYIANCDLYVCSSLSEGFSTAVSEALIIGVPVITTKVSGMEEMLGENNEYGIVTENDEEALYQAIKRIIDNKDIILHYREKAHERGKLFNSEVTVMAVEKMLMGL